MRYKNKVDMKITNLNKYFNLLMILSISLVSCNQDRNANKLSCEKKEMGYANAPGKYFLKSNSDEIKIPFELYAGNKPMITGIINGKNVKFLIDNGKLFDEIWFYNGEVDSIGLFFKSQDADSLTGIGQNDASLIFEGNQINIDFEQIQFNNQPTLISPSNAGYASYFPGINGQVSSMLFKHFIVEFDFENNIITLIKPEKFKKSEIQNAVKMHKRDNGSYCIPFELLTKTGNTYKVLLDIDLGTVFPLYLISNNKNNLPIPQKAKKQFLGLGASGEIYGYNDTLKELRFGYYVMENYPVLIVKAEYNADTSIVESGTFGIQLMRQFDVTFDYFNEIIYFKPNKNFKESKII